MIKQLFFALFLVGFSGGVHASPRVHVILGDTKLASVVSEFAVDTGVKHENPDMETAVVALRLKEGHSLQGHLTVKVEKEHETRERVYTVRKGQDSVILISGYPKNLTLLSFHLIRFEEGDPGVHVNDR